MNWQRHLILGLVFSLAFILMANYYFGWYTLGEDLIYNIVFLSEAFFVILISPIIMDLDHRNSKMTRNLLGLGLIVALSGVIIQFLSVNIEEIIFMKSYSLYIITFGILLSNVAFFSSYFFKHRGFYHSIPFAFLYSALISLFTMSIQLGALGFIGTYLHLVGDKIPTKMR